MVATLAHTLCTCITVAAIVLQLLLSGGLSTQTQRSESNTGFIDSDGICTDVGSESADGIALHRTCRVTAYCDRGLTAAGVPSGIGQCAAPADIPFGSRVYIRELDRTLIVTDRTHKRFRQNTIDVFIPERDACRRFGCKFLTCEITLPDEPHRYGSAKILTAILADDS